MNNRQRHADDCADSTISHLAGACSHVDLRHVGHAPQALHALSLPGPHRLGQNLELQVLPLAQVLALRLSIRGTWVKGNKQGER